MCGCIEEYNARMRAKLDSTTVQLATKFDHNGNERVVISGVYKKVNRAGQLCKAWTHFDVQAKFCPFCGKPYDK